MNEANKVQPWPLWGRWLFGGGFVLVLVLAAVAAIHGGFDWAAARIALVVVVVPALAMLPFRIHAARKRPSTESAPPD